MARWILYVAALALAFACHRSDVAPALAGEGVSAEPRLLPANRTAAPHARNGIAQGASKGESPPERTPDVVYVPTPQPVVDKMLEMANVRKSDVVYDLGCGDGRIVVTAAKRYGVRAYGFDIDPDRVSEAKANVERNGVGDLVTIEQRDIFELDLSPANVVTLYLLPALNVKLIPQLEKLKPGSRIVSHDFDMRGVRPAKLFEFQPEGEGRPHLVYLFNVPLDKEPPPPTETRFTRDAGQ